MLMVLRAKRRVGQKIAASPVTYSNHHTIKANVSHEHIHANLSSDN